MESVDACKINLMGISQYRLEIDVEYENKVNCDSIEKYLLKNIFNVGQEIKVEEIIISDPETGSGEYLITVYNNFMFKDF